MAESLLAQGDNKKWQCPNCTNKYVSKQKLEHHLVSAHNVKVERKYKKYEEDPTIPVPRTSSWRRRKSLKVVTPIVPRYVLHTDDPSCDQSSTLSNCDTPVDFLVSTEPEYVSLPPPSACSSNDSSSSQSTLSCSSLSSLSSLSSSSDDESRSESQTLTEGESRKLSLMAYITRYNLSDAAAKDLFELVSLVTGDSNRYQEETRFIRGGISEYHYCEECHNLFPDDPKVYRCESIECTGLRYTGKLKDQVRENPKPRASFVIGDIERQLVSILSEKKIFDLVLNRRKEALRSKPGPDIGDIMDGSEYRRVMCQPGSQPFMISGQFNFDGVVLFKSSKIDIWPIHIAINEIPANLRFRTENMVLAGVWQGNSKEMPTFQYLKTFAAHVNRLTDGFLMYVEQQCIRWIFLMLLGTFDLPAKAKAVNMTQYNGSYGCSTCEIEGTRKGSGKGTAQHYPYEDSVKLRDSNEVIRCHMPNATSDDRIKGYKGCSALVALRGFDIVKGVVPEYMHGVLLGICKIVFSLWFDSTNSKKSFYLGKKKLRVVSQRMENMKPPNEIERVPKNLFKNHQNLKGSEYQTFLLYYSFPCLIGVLPDQYLDHYLSLSEAVYILLQDRITPGDHQRATLLLDKFYSLFSSLYEDCVVGLNVHNAGKHLSYFVSLYGGLHEWSNFGYENQNGELLKMVSGTGDVKCQFFRTKRLKSYVSRTTQQRPVFPRYAKFIKNMINPRKKYQTGIELDGCNILGRALPMSAQDKSKIHLNCNDVKVVKRVLLKGTCYYSKCYIRAKTRNNYFALLHDGRVCCIDKFLVVGTEVYVLGSIYEVKIGVTEKFLGGKQFFCIEHGYEVLERVHCLKEKLFYVESDSNSFVTRMPNLFGRHVVM